MELIDKKTFDQLDWYTLNIYLKESANIDYDSKVLRKDYYETLVHVVKPLVEEKDWIKCFYYTQYFGPGNPYHIKLRIGTNGSIEKISKELDSYFKGLPNVILNYLEKATHKIEIMELDGDKKRFADLGQGTYNEEAYYWFIMHWQTGSLYFLELLSKGYENLPDLAGVPHLQWNLMSTYIPNKENENQLMFEAYGIIDRNIKSPSGVLLQPYGLILPIKSINQEE